MTTETMPQGLLDRRALWSLCAQHSTVIISFPPLLVYFPPSDRQLALGYARGFSEPNLTYRLSSGDSRQPVLGAG